MMLLLAQPISILLSPLWGLMVVHALGHLRLKPKNHFSLLFLSSPGIQLVIFSFNASFFSILLAISLDQGTGNPPLDFQKGCLNDHS